MEQLHIKYCVNKTKISSQQVEKVLTLLFQEECTVPFIARYRKEATGNLDETQIRSIESFYNECLEIEKRRKFILETLAKMEALTPELKSEIENAKTLIQLEDLYAPFKSKRKTKAALAKENGLEPLSTLIFTSNKNLEEIKSTFVITDKIKTFEDALEGAKHIIIEKIIHTSKLKDDLRQLYKTDGLFVSLIKKDANKIKDYLKFKDYFDFSEPIKKLFSPKASHRFLAMIRGKSLKILRLSIDVDLDNAISLVEKRSIASPRNLGCLDVIKDCSLIAFQKYLHPSLEREFISELKEIADETAINVFGSNLKNLLLAPYLGSKTVMGIDPGIRTGCKMVVIDQTGKLIVEHVIYLQGSKSQVDKAKIELEQIIDTLKVEYIAIGDGTFGRETLTFIEENIAQIKTKKISATLISEAGASIYSASKTAIEEFPNKDITVRGAVSIARRFQDPLSELVKIEPKSIGVGQYQHDVNESKLKNSLGYIVEDCVNYVGIDLNTASYHVLSFISGITPTVAKNIVKFRDKNGKFQERRELLKVGRFSEKVYQQATGFLRIYQGKNALDSTFIHPERYQVIKNWCQEHTIDLTDLVKKENIIQTFSNDIKIKKEIGEHTFNDIVQSLKTPSQDPRTIFKSTQFEKTLKNIEDVKVGHWYTGIINNITNFGAFVNIGIKESGLIHISELADHFVEDPMEIVKVGQEVKVKVLEVDLNRKRLALSCKEDRSIPEKKVTKKKQQTRPAKGAFASLKNFKIK